MKQSAGSHLGGRSDELYSDVVKGSNAKKEYSEVLKGNSGKKGYSTQAYSVPTKNFYNPLNC